MPFDSSNTVTIVNYENLASIVMLNGKDTTFFITRQQHPKEFDSIIKNFDQSSINKNWEAQKKTYDSEASLIMGLIISALAIMFFFTVIIPKTKVWLGVKKAKSVLKFFVGITVLIAILFYNSGHKPSAFIAIVILLILLREFLPEPKVTVENQSESNGVINDNNFSTEEDLTHIYLGKDLNFSLDELNKILLKRFPFYIQLKLAEDKEKFLLRLNKFILSKTFYIHDKDCYKEMPVLISASAIQLTYGLSKYLLPHFQFIHVFPQEFVRVDHSISFLEGNVSGQRINLSWKHFLNGVNNENDGQNVGLHEMAHALYYQIFVVDAYSHGRFKKLYDGFLTDGNKVYHYEKSLDEGLYSEYAMRNIQEFWAESVELFFEKPNELMKEYYNLYNAMCMLLNQYPASL